TSHSKIHRANEVFLDWNALLPILDTLRQAVRDDNYELVRETLLSTVQGYSPTGEIVDLLYQQHGEEVGDQGSVRTGAVRRSGGTGRGPVVSGRLSLRSGAWGCGSPGGGGGVGTHLGGRGPPFAPGAVLLHGDVAFWVCRSARGGCDMGWRIWACWARRSHR